MHAATVGLGTWEPGPKGSGILRRGTSGWDPCQLLAFQQLSALLTLWRTGWVHSIVIACLSWNGARFNNSLHCEWRGKKIQKEEETDQLEADGPISHQPRQAVGRLHSSDRGRSSFLLQLRARRFPRIPTLGPPNLSSQVLPSGDWLPLAGGLGAGATAGQRSVRVGRDGGGSPVARRGSEPRMVGGKNPRLGAK